MIPRRRLPVLLALPLAARSRRARAGAPGMATARAPAARRSPAPPSPARVFLPSPGSPLVTLRLVLRAGGADDPRGREGLVALTARLVGEGGTRRRSYAEVLDALYPMAAKIRVYGDKDAFVFEGTVHRDNLSRFADLMAEQLLEPRFDAADFKRHKQDALDYVGKTLRGNDDEELGKQALATVMYPRHPYGRPTEGTLGGLRAIKLDDARACYRRLWTRDRLIVGVGGGYPEDFPAAFAARFEALPAGQPIGALPVATIPPRPRVLLVEKNARACAISLGHPIGVTRADDDFYPLFVAASYLGEHRTFNGLLMNEMRQKRGLNYGDYAYVESFIQDGWSTFPLANIPRRQQHFEIWIRPVAPHNAPFALRHALHETAALVRDGIPQAGFDATRGFLRHYCNLWTQDVSRRLGYAIDATIYGRDLAAELRRRLPAMTRAQVDRALRRHVHPDRLAAVVVGPDAAKLRATLLSGAATPIVYDTEGTPADVLAKDELISRHPLSWRAADVRVAPVRSLFA